jgi:pimeloyl-ACP methyl ester carboxylesterase
VPDDISQYSTERAADDAAAVLKQLGVAKAHIVGLSMGSVTTMEFGIRHPDLAKSLVVIGAASEGSVDAPAHAKNQQELVEFADRIARDGVVAMSEWYCTGPTRVQFRAKDPRGFAAFKKEFAGGSALGREMAIRGMRSRRVPYYHRVAELQKVTAPMLVISGDEDIRPLELAFFLKRVVPRCGVAVLPKTGHTVNLEEPGLFNQLVQDFISNVEHDRWNEMDDSVKRAFHDRYGDSHKSAGLT